MTRCIVRSFVVPLLFLLLATPAGAQDRPRYGGELVFIVAAEPPSFDAHREETFAMLHPGAPQYNTLMRVDPTDRTGTKFVGDLAESWTISPDRRTYTFKVRQGVKFHDGSLLTSRDVKASYDHIIFPPPGVRGPFALEDAELLRKALEDGGLAEVQVEKISAPVSFDSIEAWWDMTLQLAGPLAIALAGMEPEVRESIHDRAIQLGRSAAIEEPDGISMAGSVLVGSGTAA